MRRSSLLTVTLAVLTVLLPAAASESQGDAAMQAHHYREAFDDYVAAWSTGTPTSRQLLLARKLAAAMSNLDPVPAPPALAAFHAHKAADLVKAARDAGDTDDYLLAAGEFGEAIAQAPWFGDYQFDRGLCLQLAGHLDEAAAAVRLARALARSDTSRQDADDLLAKIETTIEIKHRHAAAIRFFQGHWNGVQTMTRRSAGTDYPTDDNPSLAVTISPDGRVRLVWAISPSVSCKFDGRLEGDRIVGTRAYWKDHTGMWVLVEGHLELTKGGDLLRVHFQLTTADGSTTWVYDDFMSRL